MKQRIITAGFILVVMIGVLLVSNTIIYPLVLSLLSLFAMFELLRVLGYHKKFEVSLPAYCIASGAPILSFYARNMGYERFTIVMGTVFFAFLMYLFLISIVSSLPLMNFAQPSIYPSPHRLLANSIGSKDTFDV